MSGTWWVRRSAARFLRWFAAAGPTSRTGDESIGRGSRSGAAHDVCSGETDQEGGRTNGPFQGVAERESRAQQDGPVRRGRRARLAGRGANSDAGTPTGAPWHIRVS
ncbi:hypothetical protein GCM10027271_31500 [Saccharopolyspora gloriosae]